MGAFLEQFINATAWPMTEPASYGPFHLIFAFVGLAAAALLARRLRRLSDKGNRILLLTCGIFLLLSEIYKQLFYYYFIGQRSYQWWIFPFQLCSVPMYLCIIAPLLKPGKVQQGMYNFMMIYNLLGGFMAFVEPSGITHAYWTLTLHAFIWHLILVFIGLYLAFSDRAGKTMKDYRAASVTFLCLSGLAFCINLIFWKAAEGDINMFFVGPRISPLIVFEWIAETFGWYVSTALYLPVVCLGAFLFFLPCHLHAKKKTAA